MPKTPSSIFGSRKSTSLSTSASTPSIYRREIISRQEDYSHHQAGTVLSVDISKDETLAASGITYVNNGVVNLWDIQTGELKRHLRMDGCPNSLKFTPNGALLVASSSGKILLWNLKSERPDPVFIFDGGGESIRSISISEDGEYFLSVSETSQIILWDLLTKEPKVKANLNAVSAIALSKDGTQGVFGSTDGTVQVWQLQPQFQQLAKFVDAERASPITSVALSHDGEFILSGNLSGVVRYWNRLGQIVDSISLGFEGDTVKKSRNYKSLGTPLFPIDETRVNQGEWDWLSQLQKESILSVELSLNQMALIATQNGRVVFWHPQKGPESFEDFLGHSDSVFSVAFSPSGRMAISGSADKSSRIWDTSRIPF